MIAVQVQGKIDTLSGSYYFVRQVNTGIGQSLLKRLLKRDLFIGTPDQAVYFECGEKIFEPLQLLKPDRPIMVRRFSVPLEILVESSE